VTATLPTWLAALALCASCSLVDSARDPGGASSGGDAAVPAPDAPLEGACEAGDHITPVAAFNASPTDPQNACGLDNALALDGSVAGLDLAGSTDIGCAHVVADDEGGCGCVGVDLGAAYSLASIAVRAGPTGDACGAACDGADCGTGHSFIAFYGVQTGVYEIAGNPGMSDQLDDYDLEIAGMARYVVVCREWWSATRDDVVVDSIEGICGP
jgi:hypothetical protein